MHRFGFHSHPTTLVLSFSQPMDAVRAETLGNYTLVAPNHRHRRVIHLKAARYDPTAETVTLFPEPVPPAGPRLPDHGRLRGPLGLTNSLEPLLGGRGVGQSGTDLRGDHQPEVAR